MATTARRPGTPEKIMTTTEQWRSINRIKMAVDPDNMEKAMGLRAEYISTYGKGRPEDPPCALDDCEDTCPDPDGYRGSPFLCKKHADDRDAVLFAGL